MATDYDRLIRNAYQQQLGSIGTLQQQAYTNMYNGGYATTGTSSGIYTLQLQPDTLPGDFRHKEPASTRHPDLAWLDKRVDELRVKL